MRTLPVALLLLPGLAGCEEEGPLAACGGFAVAEGEEVDSTLHALDYTEYEGEGGAPDTEIVKDETAWAELLEAAEVDPGIEPDFATSAVWVHRWSDGGCEAPIEYPAWRWEETLRVGRSQAYNDGCDADFRQIDFIVLELDGATDLGWCE